jgi:hypothetical protein
LPAGHPFSIRTPTAGLLFFKIKLRGGGVKGDD